jgi:hypothetical protein
VPRRNGARRCAQAYLTGLLAIYESPLVPHTLAQQAPEVVCGHLARPDRVLGRRDHGPASNQVRTDNAAMALRDFDFALAVPGHGPRLRRGRRTGRRAKVELLDLETADYGLTQMIRIKGVESTTELKAICIE